MTFQCFHCSKKLSLSLPIARREECIHCGADVHVCKNCRFYDENSYNECRETSADRVKDKERANFCDYFEFGNATNSSGKKDQLRAAAEALFIKK